MRKPVLTLLSASLVLVASAPVAAQNEPAKKGLLLGKPDPSLLLGKPDPELLLGKPDPTTDASAIKGTPDPTSNVGAQEACPAPVQGGEAAADWRPPPIPPKEARDGGGKAAMMRAVRRHKVARQQPIGDHRQFLRSLRKTVPHVRRKPPKVPIGVSLQSRLNDRPPDLHSSPQVNALAYALNLTLTLSRY
ncbi:hypothetical protein [uncultured Sphingorhabdus sp.]|uniref:hypothetical protein n=1 Tax=uncultured Sphingorhabdus sp. TaxID=1686106 RepID=UPI00262B8B7A|nr:hypothetical protein [uncultured Sphingorhabdus sp.]HMS20981.1 hypothetical protein [Sphingorhabdus sp.]